MRLCANCKFYEQSRPITKCLQGHWVIADKTKPKIFNPMMFECMEYEGSHVKPKFEDDHVFDLFITMSR